MTQLATRHQPGLAHHVHQGLAWLEQCNGGVNTAALSYAALELRYAIERLAVHYWRTLLDRSLDSDDLRTIASFKRIERRIYDLAGHQREIDAHFEFMRAFVSALKLDGPLRTPHLGRMASYWDDCSELCHIAWPLASGSEEAQREAFSKLEEIAEELKQLVESAGWPILREAGIVDLRDRFVRGEASIEDVNAYMRRVGVWAKVEFPDGRSSQFVGEAIPPNSGNLR
jgi:hypothetical protein